MRLPAHVQLGGEPYTVQWRGYTSSPRAGHPVSRLLSTEWSSRVGRPRPLQTGTSGCLRCSGPRAPAWHGHAASAVVQMCVLRGPVWSCSLNATRAKFSAYLTRCLRSPPARVLLLQAALLQLSIASSGTTALSIVTTTLVTPTSPWASAVGASCLHHQLLTPMRRPAVVCCTGGERRRLTSGRTAYTRSL